MAKPGTPDLTAEAARQLHELASLGTRDWIRNGENHNLSSVEATKNDDLGMDRIGNLTAVRGRKRKAAEALAVVEISERNDVEDSGRFKTPEAQRNKAAPLSAQPAAAPGYPLFVKFGGLMPEVDLKGWVVPVDIGQPKQVTVIAGAINGQDCVGVCGTDLTPPLIALSLNKLARFPTLAPQLHCEVDTSDIPALFAVRDVINQNKPMVVQMAETRMKEFLQYPAEDKIVTLTHIMTALHAITSNDVGSLYNARESLLRVSALVVGTAKTKELIISNMSTRSDANTDGGPRSKRPKLADSAQSQIPFESPKISSLRQAATQPRENQEIHRLTAKQSRRLRIAEAEPSSKIEHYLRTMLNSPVLRKLFYFETDSSRADSSLPELRLRLDLVVSFGRRIAYEVVIPTVDDSSTWHARILGAYLPADSNRPVTRPALQLVERNFVIETNTSRLLEATGIVDWEDIVGKTVKLTENEMASADLIRAASQLPGSPGEAKVTSLRSTPLKMLQILRQDVRVSFTFAKEDVNPATTPLLAQHPVGSTKSYLISVSSSSTSPSIELQDIDKVAAVYSSRSKLLERLGQAAMRKRPPCRDEPDEVDDFE